MERQRESDSVRSEYDDEPQDDGASGGSGSRWLTVLLLFIALVFMTFAAATPVTKDFFLFSVKIKVDALITEVTNDYRFGVWGYCTTGVKNSFGIGKAKINTKLSKGGCEDRKLGWTFKDIPGMSDDVQDAISKALTTAFVLHVVAAFTIFLGLFASVVSAAKRDVPTRDTEYTEKDRYDYETSVRRKRLRRKVFMIVLLAFLFTMIVFILDVAGVVLTKNTVHRKSKGVATLDFGPAFWFVVAAFGLVLLSFILSLFDLARSPRGIEDDRSQADRSTGSRYSQNDQRQTYDDDQDGYDTVNLESPQRESEKPGRNLL